MRMMMLMMMMMMTMTLTMTSKTMMRCSRPNIVLARPDCTRQSHSTMSSVNFITIIMVIVMMMTMMELMTKMMIMRMTVTMMTQWRWKHQLRSADFSDAAYFYIYSIATSNLVFFKICSPLFLFKNFADMGSASNSYSPISGCKLFEQLILICMH